MHPIWVLVNCNSVQEAEKIGSKCLDARLASCFDVFPRKKTGYFWPPKTSKIETGAGALLTFETFAEKYRKLQDFVKDMHSDKLPFVGYVEIKGLEKDYLHWMRGEIEN